MRVAFVRSWLNRWFADEDQATADRYSEVRAVHGLTVMHSQASERSPGEIRARLLQEYPGRANPKGVSSGKHAKHLSCRKGLSGGLKLRNRDPSGRAGA
jgi:hypothetical protein